MSSVKKASRERRVKRFRNVRQTKDFLTDWDRLEASGKHDMNRLKEAMAILALNNGPMPPEWKDHQLSGRFVEYRECHVKGDLLLMYKLEESSKVEILVLSRAGTHSEIFGR